MKVLKNRVIKNAAWIIGCKIIQAVLHLVVTMISARYLGPSNYGVINYAASLVAFVVPIMQLGFRNTIVDEFVNAPDREGEILGTALTLNLLSSFACMAGVISFAMIVNAGETETIIVCGIYSLSLMFQALEMSQYWFQTKLISKYTSISMLVSYVIISITKIVLLISGNSIYWFALASSLEYLIIAILLLAAYHKKGGQRLKLSVSLGKAMFAKSKFYIVSNLMVTVFAQTDKVMLKLITGEDSVGYYAAAITCANVTSFIFYAIIDSARPSILMSKKDSLYHFEKNISILYGVIIYFSLTQCVIITAFAPLIVYILYGAEFEVSIGVLRLIVWYTTFSHLGIVRNIWILSEQKQDKLWIINLSGAVVNILLNFLLIPLWDASGAALASVITQFFTNVILCFVLKPIRRTGILMFRGLNVFSFVDEKNRV